MEMSQEVMIEFGLNLAGYIVVVLLAYMLFRLPHRAESKKTVARRSTKGQMVISEPRPVETRVLPQSSRSSGASQPDYIELAQMKVNSADSARQIKPIRNETNTDQPTNRDTQLRRRDNRREIYNQARELLSKGKSGRELLDKLPITEGELEMLSLARKA